MATSIKMLGLRFLVTIPKFLTSTGKDGLAIPTRFWISNAPEVTSAPTLYVAVIELCPLEVLLLCIYAMPGVPFTCVSIGVVTVSSTVCASAPLYVVEMLTVGGEISGY